MHFNDQLPPSQAAGVYSFPCCCGRTYIGETGRTVGKRLREHIRDFKFKNVHHSAVALHAWEIGHDFLLDKNKALATKDMWCPRRIKEALELAKRPRNINGDAGFDGITPCHDVKMQDVL
ncbi:Uncharacterized protein GBIM_20697 [Gryllus bimaculatus]|nr:Uncharacterized protein GBIM_20697 [Gryllus bimaculatus]